MNDHGNDIKSQTAYKGGAGVEVGCKVACRGNRKSNQVDECALYEIYQFKGKMRIS